MERGRTQIISNSNQLIVREDHWIFMSSVLKKYYKYRCSELRRVGTGPHQAS